MVYLRQGPAKAGNPPPVVALVAAETKEKVY